MEIYIVRHADPDYKNDSLTEKGRREAELLSERLKKIDFKQAYISPLGRAQLTAKFTLDKTNTPSETMPWLREFEGTVKTGLLKREQCWDRVPAYWTQYDEYYDYNKWLDVDMMKKGDVERHYKKVCEGIDKIIADHGYIHDGRIYRAVKPNADKIVLFCHFGVEAVILSHIFNVSPMILWHNFRALPSSVTRLVTEEREEGIAMFTALYFGDVSHLYAGDEEPSFQARFCERFTDDTRHGHDV